MRWLLVLALLLTLLPQRAAALPPNVTCTTPEEANCAELIPLEELSLPAYRTASLSLPNSTVTEAVIVIHGLSRSVELTFKAALAAAEAAGALDHTLIVAPLFPAEPAEGQLYWSSSGWKTGYTASNGPSSYAILDEIVRMLDDNEQFPNLAHVTIVGHSAGGQFANRYAAGNRVDGTIGLTMSYVVTNPSSYLYLNRERPVKGTVDRWRVPSKKKRRHCKSYNEYIYGLEDLNTYMGQTGAEQIIAQYPQRDVTYLLGSADTQRDTNLDMSCGANLEGPNRYKRGLAYAGFIEHFFPENNHQVVVVPDVGHVSWYMYGSVEGQVVIFGQSNA